MTTSIKTFFASALAAIVLTASAFTSKANTIEPTMANNYKLVISNFMDSYKTNNTKKMKAVLSENASYKYTRDNKVVSHTAKQLLAFVKQNDGVTLQDCKLNYQIVSQSDAMVIAKISINNGLNNESKQYVTLENNGKGDWKITQIYQVYTPVIDKGVLAKN